MIIANEDDRTALEWVIDQYRVTGDEQGHIVRLIGQAITVSLETVKVVRGLM